MKDFCEKFKSLMGGIVEDNQKIERSPVLMVQKDQHSKNSHPTKRNIQIQCNLHKNFNTILYRPSKDNSQLHIEKEKIQRELKKFLYNKRISAGVTIPEFKLYRAIVIKRT